ncbi:MAG: NAD(P)-dependent glycerol-3-phosphate dehydrogenase [Candidatus Acetothermia bacterium]|jgi:glycerol-3-phosphate dehydrogenase (NAD(P)+)|nr:NAD(P)-dependent glycerol-3-phosphate dehydrogenase [Candidatus Acetothermia bacterium]MDH7505469.1 NAD(P)H-dependent glycerol-3-phosphate dehydrogenase [Candidatus Acetothermia bacterium]
MDFVVLGGGGWGTAIARLLARKGHRTSLWVRDPELARQLSAERENKKYLPEVELPESLEILSDLAQASGRGEAFLLAVPSFATRGLARQLAAIFSRRTSPLCLINLAKGIEQGSGKTMSEILREELGPRPIFTLSGPCHAEEVGRDFPTTVVIAGEDLELGRKLQEALMTERFRVYLSDDLKGVEYGGTVKNIIALAAGISDGLGYGDNAKGALIARGLVEMVRLAIRLGARKETLFGLSGLGDLVTTCTSRHSRNRLVGYRLGRGESLQQILNEMEMVAEGVYATDAVRQLARKLGVEMPITEAVYAILYEGARPLNKLTELMTREPKMETL